MLAARPLIALPDGTVIAGNMRLRAAQALGWETVPTVYVDLDENRAREWALRDNAGYGQWDDADLQVLLLEMQADGARLELTGFDEDALARLLADGAAVDLPPDIDDAPPLPAEPRSVPGEVYDLGPHRVMCGDATDRLHMPRRWPWAVAFSAALERLRAVALQI